jgi:hypothetical protein
MPKLLNDFEQRALAISLGHSTTSVFRQPDEETAFWMRVARERKTLTRSG